MQKFPYRTLLSFPNCVRLDEWLTLLLSRFTFDQGLQSSVLPCSQGFLDQVIAHLAAENQKLIGETERKLVQVTMG